MSDEVHNDEQRDMQEASLSKESEPTGNPKFPPFVVQAQTPNNQSLSYGCATGFLSMLLFGVLGAFLGGLLGAMQGHQMGKGIDAIFPPVLWTTPLGALIGAIALPALISALSASSSKISSATCPHCQKPTDASAKFCGNCGRSLDRAD